MNLINRPIYTDRIKPFIGKGIIKVLTGQRRVGKSYILKQLQKDSLENEPQANIVYINMEFEEFRNIRNDSDPVSYTHLDVYKRQSYYLSKNKEKWAKRM